jgi:tRNA(Ile)-lysidine synthase
LPTLRDLNPNLSATLARTADLLGAEADYAAQRDAAALAAVTLEHSPERRLLDRDRLCAQHIAVQRGLLRLALLRLGVDLRVGGLTQIDEILARVHARQTGGPFPLSAGWAWTLLGAYAGRAAQVAIHRAAALPLVPPHPHWATPPAGLHPLPIPGTLDLGAWRLHSALGPLPPEPDALLPPAWRVQLDADRVGALALTAPQPGMRIAPLGMAGRHKTLGDLFTDRKLPRALRAGWPVIVDHTDTVVWVCGLCLADGVKLRPTTRRPLSLWWTPTLQGNPHE